MKTQKKESLEKAHLHQEIILGILAGIIFSLFAWGYDGFLLQKYHGALPWLKLAVGVIPIVLVFSFMTWIALKINNMIVRALLWMIAATGVSYLISTLTFNASEVVVRAFFPQIGQYIQYVAPEGIRSRLLIILVMTNILFILGGLLIDMASDALITSSGIIGWTFPIILCLAFFAGAGFTADSNFNADLRGHIISLDEQLQEVADLNMSELTEREQRLVRRYTKLDVDLDGPRKLILGSFDPTFSQSKVWIDFNGKWATCTALNGRVNDCEMLE